MLTQWQILLESYSAYYTGLPTALRLARQLARQNKMLSLLEVSNALLMINLYSTIRYSSCSFVACTSCALYQLCRICNYTSAGGIIFYCQSFFLFFLSPQDLRDGSTDREPF